MIRTNKNLLKFTSILILSGVLLILIFQKFSPLLSHTVYYCQSYLSNLSNPIPFQISILPVLFLSAIIGIAVGKVVFTLLRIQFLKNKLIKDVTTEKKLRSLLMKLELSKKTVLVKSNKPFAFCLGIMHPKIYVSTQMVSLMNNIELEAILCHEKYHLTNRDTFIMLLASVGESLFPFFPLLSDVLRNYRIEREVKADNEAIKRLGYTDPLVSVLRKLLIYPSSHSTPVAAIADQETLEPRIHALVKHEFHFKKYKMRNIFISCISIIILSLIMIAPVHAFDFHDEENDVVMICPDGNSCMKACEQKYLTEQKNHSENVLYSPAR